MKQPRQWREILNFGSARPPPTASQQQY